MNTFSEFVALLNEEVLEESGLTSADQISTRYCPYAQGVNNNGIIIPSREILIGNPATQSWCDMMTFFDVTSINYWLDISSVFKDSMLSEMLRMVPRTCMSHVLPYVVYTPQPEFVSIRQGTLLDVVAEYNLQSVNDLRVYLFSLVILGIFLNDYMAEQVFNIQNMREFLAARLFQGELDHKLNERNFLPSPGGVFVTAYGGGGEGTYSSLPFFNSVNGPLTSEEFNSLVTRERVKVSTCRFLGNDTPQVIAMKDALSLSDTYTKYLTTRDDRFSKVGGRVFENITLGSSTRKDYVFMDQSKREVTMPYANPPSQGRSVEKWFTGMVRNLVDPVYGTPVANFNGPLNANNRGSATASMSESQHF